MDKLIFGHDMIILIKYKADWELLSQINQAEINKDNIIENRKIVDNKYKTILDNRAAYKYETSYKGPFEIT